MIAQISVSSYGRLGFSQYNNVSEIENINAAKPIAETKPSSLEEGQQILADKGFELVEYVPDVFHTGGAKTTQWYYYATPDSVHELKAYLADVEEVSPPLPAIQDPETRSYLLSASKTFSENRNDSVLTDRLETIIKEVAAYHSNARMWSTYDLLRNPNELDADHRTPAQCIALYESQYRNALLELAKLANQVQG